MYDLITIGAATRDVFLKSKKITTHKDAHYRTGSALCFDMDSKNELDEVHLSTGGGATNAAITFARQGLKTASIVRVGSDSFGKEIIDELKKEKVSVEFVQKDKKPETGYSTIITATDGSRVILVKRGVSADIKFADIKLSKLKTRWIYISSLGGDLALLSKILNFAKKNKIKTAWNPGQKELNAGLERLKPLIKSVDAFMLNKDEASALLNLPFKNDAEIFQKLENMVKGIVVMTKGKEGVSVYDGKDIYCAGIPKSPIVGRTGAGDAFNSGFVSAIASGKEISYAIQLGTANSTSLIQHFSAKTGLLKKDQWGKYPRVKVSKNKCF
ncbi:carbohydrate kinase family protein [Candidatus Azambacteria bacterium]|nr:carbohydrate kinase family protein [Candidatus Azambacteria bacterium]